MQGHFHGGEFISEVLHELSFVHLCDQVIMLEGFTIAPFDCFINLCHELIDIVDAGDNLLAGVVIPECLLLLG